MPEPDTKSADLQSTQAEFSALLEQHRGIVAKVAFAYCSHQEDRKELTQEIAAQLWRSYRKYDPDRKFSTWMYRVSLNVAISWVRRHARHRAHILTIAEEIDAVPMPDAPEQDPRLEILTRLIAEFDPMHRALFALYLDDHSYREISEVLGISETNVATKISRLKQRVRERTKNLNWA